MKEERYIAHSGDYYAYFDGKRDQYVVVKGTTIVCFCINSIGSQENAVKICEAMDKYDEHVKFTKEANARSNSYG